MFSFQIITRIFYVLIFVLFCYKIVTSYLHFLSQSLPKEEYDQLKTSLNSVYVLCKSHGFEYEFVNYITVVLRFEKGQFILFHF